MSERISGLASVLLQATTSSRPGEQHERDDEKLAALGVNGCFSN